MKSQNALYLMGKSMNQGSSHLVVSVKRFKMGCKSGRAVPVDDCFGSGRCLRSWLSRSSSANLRLVAGAAAAVSVQALALLFLACLFSPFFFMKVVGALVADGDVVMPALAAHHDDAGCLAGAHWDAVSAWHFAIGPRFEDESLKRWVHRYNIHMRTRIEMSAVRAQQRRKARLFSAWVSIWTFS
jgi:hypothetical protein